MCLCIHIIVQDPIRSFLVGLAPHCKGPTILDVRVCIKGFLWKNGKTIHHHLCIHSAVSTLLHHPLQYIPHASMPMLCVQGLFFTTYKLQFIVTILYYRPLPSYARLRREILNSIQLLLGALANRGYFQSLRVLSGCIL